MSAFRRERLSISYNEITDIVTIEGKDYSGDFFRHFAAPVHPGDHRVFKIVESPTEGVVYLSVIDDRIISAEFNRQVKH